MLNHAMEKGIPIYRIHKTNMGTLLNKLSISPELSNDIKNAVNAGLHVIVPGKSVYKEGWEGTGYVIEDPVSGDAAYRITGGMAGGLKPQSSCGKNLGVIDGFCKMVIPKTHADVMTLLGSLFILFATVPVLEFSVVVASLLAPFWIGVLLIAAAILAIALLLVTLDYLKTRDTKTHPVWTALLLAALVLLLVAPFLFLGAFLVGSLIAGAAASWIFVIDVLLVGAFLGIANISAKEGGTKTP